MKTTMILFDLDGTLLPMDQDTFVGGYFKFLAQKLAPYGYEPKALVDGIWAGTAAMVKNDGSRLNEEAFWEKFREIFGEQAMEHYPLFEEFYDKDFPLAKQFTGYNEEAAKAVHAVKDLGFRTALATNPLFPETATKTRIGWTGMKPEEFELYTTYENSRTCKPNPKYYLEVAERLGVAPEECLMVGNDVGEDMIARTVGMKVFLITDCLINKKNEDLSQFPNGTFADLVQYVTTLNEEGK